MKISKLARLSWLVFLIAPWVHSGDAPVRPYLQDVGASTNGLYSTVLAETCHQGQDYWIRVYVWLDHSKTNFNHSLYFGQTNLGGSHRTFNSKYFRVGHFFEPLNSFCGPVELRDQAGNLVPLCKPEVNRMEDYPLFFTSESLSQSRYWPKESEFMPQKLWPNPLIGGRAELPGFSLTNIFQLEKAGRYQLRISPMIYRRALTNEDYCERIDLPFVTLELER